MHMRRLDIRQRAHRVLEFALERALKVYLLVKLRAHPVGLVEDLKSQPAALHPALGRCRDTRLVEHRGRNANSGSIRRHVKADLRLRQNSVPYLPSIVRGRDRCRACANPVAPSARSSMPPAPQSVRRQSSRRGVVPAPFGPKTPAPVPNRQPHDRPIAAAPALPALSFRVVPQVPFALCPISVLSIP